MGVGTQEILIKMGVGTQTILKDFPIVVLLLFTPVQYYITISTKSTEMTLAVSSLVYTASYI